MKTFHASMAVLALGVLCAAGLGGPRQDVEKDCLRVGVFDSRALAVAYTRSKQHEEWLDGLRAEQERAREQGDEERVREIDAQGRDSQALRHKQAFGTAPVDDVLEALRDEIPAIAERAGVDLIVSEWRIAHLAEDAEVVDVTDLLVEPFHPSEKTRGILRDLDGREPLPLYGTDWEAMERH